jgi:hypothetical protein
VIRTFQGFGAGLPDGMFIKPKISILVILEGLGIVKLGIFYVHLEHITAIWNIGITAIWNILRPFGIY